MQHKLNPEQGKPDYIFYFLAPSLQYVVSTPYTLLTLSSLLFYPSSPSARFGVSQTSEESSRSSMENGGRERDHGSESDEEEDSEQNISDNGTSEDSNYQQNTSDNGRSEDSSYQQNTSDNGKLQDSSYQQNTQNS